MVDANLGTRDAGRSIEAKAAAALSLVPAAWSVLRLAWYVRRRGIELIHTADRPRDAAVAVLLSRITRAKCIVHAHVGFDAEWMRGIAAAGDPRCRRARIAISEYVAGTLRDAGCDPRSTYVVLNGIEPARWQPGTRARAIRRELAIDDTTPVVLTVCRLFRAKGVSELIKALHDVSDEVPIRGAPRRRRGDGSRTISTSCASMVRAYDLDDRVRFLGRRDDVPALMAAADVFAMPSHIRAVRLGLSRRPWRWRCRSWRSTTAERCEVVEQGVTGLLSPPGRQRRPGRQPAPSLARR